MEIEIFKTGTRAFLKLGAETVEVKDYKISSSIHGRTELEAVFDFDDETTAFLIDQYEALGVWDVLRGVSAANARYETIREILGAVGKIKEARV